MIQPNILFVFPDQHRFDWMPYPSEVMARLGMEPLDLRVPHISKLMKRGVTFYRNISPAPVCAPARACLATGLNYSRCGCKGNGENTPTDKKTFYKVLRDGGYNVGGVGKFDLHKPDFDWGRDPIGWHWKLEKYGFTKEFSIDSEGKRAGIKSAVNEFLEPGKRKRFKNPSQYRPWGPYMTFLHERGLMHEHIKDFNRRTGPFSMFITEVTPLPDDAYDDNWVGQNAVIMLKKFPKDQPWFLQVNFPGPHEPWDITKKMRESVERRQYPLPTGSAEEMAEELVDVRRNYTAMVENIDRNIGLMLEEVEKRGELDNTIVIYSSDHGEMLGDFGMWGKHKPWRGSERVPLVIAGPNIGKDMISDALVELQDLASTIVDYAGFSMPEAADSISLRPILEGDDEAHVHREYQCACLKESQKIYWKTITDGVFKLAREGGKTRLFNLKEDPWENVDISKENPDIVLKLEEMVDKLVPDPE
ncbi:MAG: sulfatase [Candidatus Hodarchaeota archaeon]